LRLSAAVGAHGDVAVGASGKARVDTSAESSFAFFAIAATAVGDVKGHDDAIAFLEEGYARAQLFDYAHVLVAECDTSFCSSSAFVHVEV